MECSFQLPTSQGLKVWGRQHNNFLRVQGGLQTVGFDLGPGRCISGNGMLTLGHEVAFEVYIKGRVRGEPRRGIKMAFGGEGL